MQWLTKRNVFILAAIVLLIAAALVWWLASTPAFSPAMHEAAWQACTEVVAQRLEIPADEAEAYRYTAVTSPSPNTYQVDIYYISRLITYRCTVAHTLEGDWQLKDLHGS